MAHLSPNGPPPLLRKMHSPKSIFIVLNQNLCNLPINKNEGGVLKI